MIRAVPCACRDNIAEVMRIRSGMRLAQCRACGLIARPDAPLRTRWNVSMTASTTGASRPNSPVRETISRSMRSGASSRASGILIDSRTPTRLLRVILLMSAAEEADCSTWRGKQDGRSWDSIRPATERFPVLPKLKFAVLHGLS